MRKKKSDYISQEWLSKELELEEARLKEIEEKGAEALSDYDRNIASDSDEEAVSTAKRLIKAHISYYKKQMNRGLMRFL